MEVEGWRYCRSSPRTYRLSAIQPITSIMMHYKEAREAFCFAHYARRHPATTPRQAGSCSYPAHVFEAWLILIKVCSNRRALTRETSCPSPPGNNTALQRLLVAAGTSNGLWNILQIPILKCPSPLKRQSFDEKLYVTAIQESPKSSFVVTSRLEDLAVFVQSSPAKARKT
jgi:hypothetical protein